MTDRKKHLKMKQFKWFCPTHACTTPLPLQLGISGNASARLQQFNCSFALVSWLGGGGSWSSAEQFQGASPRSSPRATTTNTSALALTFDAMVAMTLSLVVPCPSLESGVAIASGLALAFVSWREERWVCRPPWWWSLSVSYVSASKIKRWFSFPYFLFCLFNLSGLTLGAVFCNCVTHVVYTYAPCV